MALRLQYTDLTQQNFPSGDVMFLREGKLITDIAGKMDQFYPNTEYLETVGGITKGYKLLDQYEDLFTRSGKSVAYSYFVQTRTGGNTTETDPTALKKAGLVADRLIYATGTTATTGTPAQTVTTKTALDAAIGATYSSNLSLDARMLAQENKSTDTDKTVTNTAVPVSGTKASPTVLTPANLPALLEDGDYYVFSATDVGTNKGYYTYPNGIVYSVSVGDRISYNKGDNQYKFEGVGANQKASEVPYLNTASGIPATDVQGAIDSLDQTLDGLLTNPVNTIVTDSFGFSANLPLTIKGSQTGTPQNEVVTKIENSELRFSVEYPTMVVNSNYSIDVTTLSDNSMVFADTDNAGADITIDLNAFQKHIDNLLDNNKNRTKTITIKNTGKSGFDTTVNSPDRDIDWLGTSLVLADDEAITLAFVIINQKWAIISDKRNITAPATTVAISNPSPRNLLVNVNGANSNILNIAETRTDLTNTQLTNTQTTATQGAFDGQIAVASDGSKQLYSWNNTTSKWVLQENIKPTKHLDFRKTLKDLEVTTGAYTGAYRQSPNGKINWYFCNIALTKMVGKLPKNKIVEYLDLYLSKVKTTGTSLYSIMDIDTNLTTLVDPDSMDSYSATFLSLAMTYVRYYNDIAWFTNNLPLLKNIAYYNLVLTQKASGLVNTFQSDYTGIGNSYKTVAQLMDNCEAYRGVKDFSDLLFDTKNTVDGTYYQGVANGISAGVGSLFDVANNKFKINDANPTDTGAFYPFAIAQIYPELYQVPLEAPVPQSSYLFSQPTMDKYAGGFERLNFLAPNFDTTEYDAFPLLAIGYYMAKYRQSTSVAENMLNRMINTKLTNFNTNLGLITVNEMGWAEGIRDTLNNTQYGTIENITIDIDKGALAAGVYPSTSVLECKEMQGIELLSMSVTQTGTTSTAIVYTLQINGNNIGSLLSIPAGTNGTKAITLNNKMFYNDKLTLTILGSNNATNSVITIANRILTSNYNLKN